jgi:hypothetical protein
MNQQKQITNFIKHIVDNNYSAADKTLQSIVSEKIKARIQKAETTLTNKNSKKS